MGLPNLSNPLEPEFDDYYDEETMASITAAVAAGYDVPPVPVSTVALTLPLNMRAMSPSLRPPSPPAPEHIAGLTTGMITKLMQPTLPGIDATEVLACPFATLALVVYCHRHSLPPLSFFHRLQLTVTPAEPPPEYEQEFVEGFYFRPFHVDRKRSGGLLSQPPQPTSPVQGHSPSPPRRALGIAGFALKGDSVHPAVSPSKSKRRLVETARPAPAAERSPMPRGAPVPRGSAYGGLGATSPRPQTVSEMHSPSAWRSGPSAASSPMPSGRPFTGFGHRTPPPSSPMASRKIALPASPANRPPSSGM